MNYSLRSWIEFGYISSLVFLCILLCSCIAGSAKSNSAGSTPPNPTVTQAATPGLPSLDSLEQAARKTTAIQNDLLKNAPVLQSQSGAAYTLGNLGLAPAQGQAAWAVFSIGGMHPEGRIIPELLTATSNEPCWLAVADYGQQKWIFIEHTGTNNYVQENGQNLISPSGNCFVAAIAWETPAVVSQLELETREEPVELWLYLQRNLYVQANLDEAIALVQNAAAIGYTTVVLADYKLGVIDLYGEDYHSNLREFVQAANLAGVEVIPSLVPIGYSDAFFSHDPNLIEAQPVVDCLFRADSGEADVVQNPAAVVLNGDFSDYNGDDFDNWVQMDGAGTSTFADTGDYHSAPASIRFDDFLNGSASGNDRIRQVLTVEPWQCYALSFWLKTEDVSPVGSLWIRAFKPDISGNLSYNEFAISPTQDWTQYHLVFNSQEFTTVPVYIGIWAGQSGRFWLDDVTLENAGLINLVRREGTPFSLTSEDGLVTYTEGVDYEFVNDPLLGEAGSWTGTFDLYHERPVITLTSGTGISNGENLLADYYHAAFVYQMQGACCLTDEGVFTVIEDTLNIINEQAGASGVMVAVDEMRIANWCAACQNRGISPGALLADATMRIDTIAKGINPGWRLMVWSDMYDPFHNAHDDYYLVNGDLSGSWDGLPPYWDIGNWNRHSGRVDSLDFFAGRGHRQILAGYYDEPGPDFSIIGWLGDARNHGGVFAVMYTTWQSDFSDIEAWATAVRDWEADN